ncbi:MAG: 4-(cytidine 5'-diphospho)-2-C-methyl-D-erythritol kinase, partial [Rhodanobacteraceae bacterium]
LQTVFQLLDWGDDVRIRVRDDGDLRRVDSLPGVAPEDDLGLRAAQALRDASATKLGADIGVTKRIPIGGGLGGGSSDAASVLVALNAMWNTGLGDDALAAIGLALGADVPVFVRGRSAWSEGIGEQLTPIELPERWFVVVDPGARVPTRELFQVPDLTRNSPQLTIPLFASGAATGNAFEPVVRARFPEVAAALDWLGGFGPARLSGSGGCVFVPIGSRDEGLAVLAECPPGMRGFVVQGVAESPLRRRLAEWREKRVS